MKPKKSLGQNFLRDEKVLAEIVGAADLSREDSVLEVGPGEGILTERLAEKAGGVIAIEKDDSLAVLLDSRWRGNANVKITHADILEVNLPQLIRENNFQNYKVVANIPYYITSPIIQLFLETEYPPNMMVLMVQKEVAQRICAGPGEMSILSVSVQYYAKPELLFYVDKKSFWPVPEVDSAVIKITPFFSSQISVLSAEEGVDDSKKFFRVVRAGFSAKRKMLLNNLSNSLHMNKKEIEDKIKKAGLGPTQRAQELTVEDWRKLTAQFREI